MITKEQAKRMVGSGWSKLIDRLFEVVNPEELEDIKEK